jgi:hypothetical protein
MEEPRVLQSSKIENNSDGELNMGKQSRLNQQPHLAEKNSQSEGSRAEKNSQSEGSGTCIASDKISISVSC